MKSKICMALIGFLLIAGVSTSFAAPVVNKSEPVNSHAINMTEEQAKARAEEIKLRINEIKGMDRSSLTASERKALRKELRDIKKEARAIRGVYLSVGAIIIIILLLILII